MLWTWLAFAALGVLGGCTPQGDTPTRTAPATLADTDPPSRQDTDPPPGPDPLWYSVDGWLTIQDGQAGPALLTVGLWGLDPARATVQLCVEDHTLPAGSAAIALPDSSELFGAWTFPLANPSCPGLPGQVQLGIGPLVAPLWPAAEAAGASVRHSRALYLAAPPQPTVFGLAATAQQAAGQGAPPSLDPLPDGRYLLRGVWLLPL